MVKFYVSRIKEGKMLLEDVPNRWHDKVKEVLETEQK